MRRTEQNDQPCEDIEHTRVIYGSTVDYVRALERSGALRFPEDTRPDIPHWRRELTLSPEA